MDIITVLNDDKTVEVIHRLAKGHLQAFYHWF